LDYVKINADVWNAKHDEQLAIARRGWGSIETTWGIFKVPEREAHLLPREVEGRRVVELGCGTAYVSAWLARRGAVPIGVDPAMGQLEIARICQDEHGLHFPLVQGQGEHVPLASNSFDLVISEYGAAIWADPLIWIPEAARLLRSGGELVFLGNSTLLMLCVPEYEGIPATREIQRAQRGMHRFEWPDDPSIEFHLGHGDWIRLLTANDLEVIDLVELWPPEGAVSPYPHVTADWARFWPCEEVWKARKR